MNNGAVRCGSTVCNQVSKTFTENPLPIGYYHVATIPAGASNISILELKNSENYLGMYGNFSCESQRNGSIRLNNRLN